MCGIAGGFGKPDAEKINTMLRMMEKRGPDDRGIYTSHDVVLGHNRLTIIDLNAGSQPLFNEDGTISLVFNGEIYNYRQLRKWLKNKGHVFKTDTDSEVLLHLYEELGPDMVYKLDGMFAFAIYSRDGFLMARDPLGIKPLYYGKDSEGTLYFASEIKGLLQITGDVKEFPNGHLYTDKEGFRRYFRIDSGKEISADEETLIEKLEEKLSKAVQKRLMADVPLGVFLSGGLDSSLIAAIARKYVDGQLHSFAVGIKGSEDLYYSRMVAEHLGTTHHVFEYTKEDVIEALPKVIYYLESFDPALVRSAIPTYFVSRLASKYVKVVLSGEGADELFAGYEYLKRRDIKDINEELLRLTNALHNTNLQRVDRMTMANSIEGRVPFLDVEIVNFAFSIKEELKLSPTKHTEKWILRKVAEKYLPRQVVWRKKEKFAHGTGTSRILASWAKNEASAYVTEGETHGAGAGSCKEEQVYRKIFKRHFPKVKDASFVGKTRSVLPGEIS
ncbi:MAG: hypothetical protein PWQ97_1092 [Tepidanaerobacteraceae bacterium]|nr:hypothetical protein [Tepidanaerobacteraceae bacterium]